MDILAKFNYLIDLVDNKPKFSVRTASPEPRQDESRLEITIDSDKRTYWSKSPEEGPYHPLEQTYHPLEQLSEGSVGDILKEIANITCDNPNVESFYSDNHGPIRMVHLQTRNALEAYLNKKSSTREGPRE